MLERIEDKIILTADNEEPDCMYCDNCTGNYNCDKCGAEYGWAGYKRTVSEEEYWNGK